MFAGFRSVSVDMRLRLPFHFLSGPFDKAGCPAFRVSCLARGNDEHPIVRGVLQAEQAAEVRGEFLPVWRGCPEQVFGAAVVVAAVQAPEADAADSIGCGYAAEDRKADGDVEVLVAATFGEYGLSHVQVCLRGPEPGPGFASAARCRAW